MRSMRALPPPRNSTSRTSSPLEAATRSAITRTRSTSSAMNPIAYWRMAATPTGLQLKSGLAPTGVLRQVPVHSSLQFLNIRPERGKRQTARSVHQALIRHSRSRVRGIGLGEVRTSPVLLQSETSHRANSRISPNTRSRQKGRSGPRSEHYFQARKFAGRIQEENVRLARTTQPEWDEIGGSQCAPTGKLSRWM